MTKVERHGIFGGRRPDGWLHHVSCGVRTDGSSPAKAFLGALAGGTWEEDPDAVQIPDDEQVKDYAALRHKMKYVAENGEPERATDVNYLHGGVWEFKHGVKRLAFVDTDGRGGFVPKGKIKDRADSPDQTSPCWWFPEMDAHIRLLNAWGKTGPAAKPMDIETAKTIAEEDRRHDST